LAAVAEQVLQVQLAELLRLMLAVVEALQIQVLEH
jgi:hypothetical protein